MYLDDNEQYLLECYLAEVDSLDISGLQWQLDNPKSQQKLEAANHY